MPLVPELSVSDIKQNLRFYIDILGFSIDWQRPEAGFATVSLEDCRLMLEQYSSSEKATDEEIKQGHWRVAKFEYQPLYAKLKEANYPIKLDLYQTQYRVNEQMISVQQFLVMDPDGYLLRFATELN